MNINRILHDAYAEDGLPNDSTVRRWQREFLVGHSSLEDEERCG